MAGLLDVTGFLSPLLNKLADFIPDPAQKAAALAAAQTEMLNFVGAQALAQTSINQAEAGSGSLFVAGWRPMVGWICGAAFAYTFLVAPVLGLVLVNVPVPDTASLMAPLMGLLGLGGMRTYEKTQGVASKGIT